MARSTKRSGRSRGRATGAKRRSIFWRWRRVLFLLGLVLVAGLAGAAYVVSSIPLPPEELQEQTTFIFDASGAKLAELHAEEDRVNVTLDEIPDVMVDAVLAAEDRDFFDHSGVDPLAILRATWADVRNKSVKQGGSTITQQYVKNVYLDRERTLTRKIKEAVLAVKLEREFEKPEILERYFNTVYFGRGAYGVQAAAQAYFDKNVGDLVLREAAYLAGLIRAPELADATVHPEEADARRRSVLAAMVRNDVITEEQRAKVEKHPVASYVKPRPDNRETEVAQKEIGTEYFVEYVRKYLSRKYGDATVYGGGLRVHTTLDLRMQRAAMEAVSSTLDRPDDPAAAVVAVDEGGHIRAMLGGRDFRNQKVNYAVGKGGGGTGRQPGSAFKPFVLAEAVREGYTVESAFRAPGTIVIPGADAGGDWEVDNYGGAEKGTQNLIEATRDSTNTVYAQLIVELGAEKVAALAERMGITTDLPPNNSLALGTPEVSVLDMASAFSTFANRGLHNEPRGIVRVETADGRVLESHTPRPEEILTSEQADIVNHCLRQVVESGTGTAARIGRPAAGKTGTTQNNGDAWFAGYTPKLTAVVWMGYPEGQQREMNSVHGRAVTGGSFPAEIWRKFMSVAVEGIDTGTFPTVTSFPGERLNPEILVPEETSTTSSSTTSSSTPTTRKPKPKPKPTTTTTTKPTTTTTKKPTTTTTTTTPPTTDGGGGGGGGAGQPSG